MFRKKSSSSGKQDGSKVTNAISFAYDIPAKDVDPNSDWGKPNFDKAQQYSNRVRYKEFLKKTHFFLYSIIAILVFVCAVMILILVFGTEYEIAYVDDGTTLMCRVE